jgi:hypothetical protein
LVFGDESLLFLEVRFKDLTLLISSVLADIAHPPPVSSFLPPSEILLKRVYLMLLFDSTSASHSLLYHFKLVDKVILQAMMRSFEEIEVVIGEFKSHLLELIDRESVHIWQGSKWPGPLTFWICSTFEPSSIETISSTLEKSIWPKCYPTSITL